MKLFEKSFGWLLAALLAAPFSQATPRPQQTAASSSVASSVASSSGQAQAPGLETRPQPAADQDSAGQQQARTGQEQAQAGQQSSQPVGTAAAPYEKATGITASRPAGAVIAPAKQRRVRSILIKVGIVVGAGAAVAAVAALSHASPSQPH